MILGRHIRIGRESSVSQVVEEGVENDQDQDGRDETARDTEHGQDDVFRGGRGRVRQATEALGRGLGLSA